MTSAASIQAPVGGWNAKDSFDDMAAEDAVIMTNLVPKSGYAESRKGYTLYAALDGPAALNYGESLFASQTGLFAGYAGQIIDVTNGGYNIVVSTGILEATQWQTTHFQDKLIAVCNENTGSKAPGQVIDSTNNATTLVVSGTGLPTTFWGCNTFKGRVYYWAKDSREFWYAEAGAFQGALTSFDLSMQIQTGGTLVMMITYTLDSGDGVDDLAVFVFSTGETLIYQGDDPSNFLRWSSSGRFQIGEPLGIRAHQKVGGTEIILTKDGYVDLAQALRNGRYSEDSSYSNKIIRAAKDAARDYGGLFGWECILYPAGNLFIVNVPQSEETLIPQGDGTNSYSIGAVQHVRNTSTGAWCKFEGLPANAFCVFNDNLYFINSNGVYQADVGSSDGGYPITITCVPAFNHLGSPGRRKTLTAASHVTNFQVPEYLVKDGMADFDMTFVNNVPLSAYGGVAKWNVSKWNESKWAVGYNQLTNTTMSWTDVWAEGNYVTVSLRANIFGTPFIWYGSTYLYRNIGVI